MIRPTLSERRQYAPNLPVEVFMVRILKAHIESAIRELLGDKQARRVIDIGCGGQPFRSLIEELGHAYTGVDAQNPLGIVDHIVEIDGPLPDPLVAAGPFDFILCTEVLEHVVDWDRAFANFSTLLALGGRIVLTCPFFYVLHEEPYDFWRPTPHAIRHYATKHGLEEVSILRVGSPWDVIGTALGAIHGSARATGRRLDYRLCAYLADKLLRLAFTLLERQSVQPRVTLRNDRLPLYLSNIAVLRKSVDT